MPLVLAVELLRLPPRKKDKPDLRLPEEPRTNCNSSSPPPLLRDCNRRDLQITGYTYVPNILSMDQGSGFEIQSRSHGTTTRILCAVLPQFPCSYLSVLASGA